MIGFVLIDSYMQLIDEEEESNSNSRMPTQASAKRRLIFFLNSSLIMNFIGTKANHTKCKLSGQCACVRAFVRTLFFIGIALLHLLNVISRNLTMHERSVHNAYTSSVHISSSLFAYYPAFILFVDKSVLFFLNVQSVITVTHRLPASMRFRKKAAKNWNAAFASDFLEHIQVSSLLERMLGNI